MKDFDLITFDCYGTLIDWENGIYQAFRNEAAKDGRQLERGSVIGAYVAAEAEIEGKGFIPYRQVLNQAAQGCASKLGWNLTEERASFLAKSLPSWQPFPNTNPALERLAPSFHLGILSNVDDDLLLESLGHLTVSFEMIVTAGEIRSYKPGRGHFDEAILRPCGIVNNKSQIKNLRSEICHLSLRAKRAAGPELLSRHPSGIGAQYPRGMD